MRYGILCSAPSFLANMRNGSFSSTTNCSLLPLNFSDDDDDDDIVHGWQYQKWPPTIQCAVEEALIRGTKLERTDLCLAAASRTGKGVHALGQVAHFVAPFSFDNLDSSHAALNHLLHCDIRVREVSPTVPEFHAQFSLESKVYHYKIYLDSVMDPFLHRYAYHCPYKLNTGAMREAARYFIGKHDFSAFANAVRNDGVVRNPVKNIYRVDVNEMGILLQIEVEGSGFLYRQVRNMVARLLQVGMKAIPPDIVPMSLLSMPLFCNCQFKEEHLQLPPSCTSGSIGRHHTITRCNLPF